MHMAISGIKLKPKGNSTVPPNHTSRTLQKLLTLLSVFGDEGTAYHQRRKCRIFSTDGMGCVRYRRQGAVAQLVRAGDS